MMLLNQKAAAELDLYFEDSDLEPGSEWATFLQKLQEKTQNPPGLTPAFSVGYRAGYPGGWATALESVSGGVEDEPAKDPLLKVMRRLDQGALVKRLQGEERTRSESVLEEAESSGDPTGGAEETGANEVGVRGDSKAVHRDRVWKRCKNSVGDIGSVNTYPPLGKAARMRQSLAPDQLYMEAANRMLALLLGGPGTAENEGGIRQRMKDACEIEFQEERPTMWQVVIDGEEVNVWEGEKASIATAVLDLCGLPPPWRIGDPATCYRTLEPALRLYHLLVVATKELVVARASNRAVPGPLAPLVKHLGRSTGKCLSPKVFRAAAEAGLALIVFCKGFTSLGGLEQALGVASLLRYSPQLSTRLVRPPGKGAQKDASGGESKAAVKGWAKGKAVVGTTTSNSNTANSREGTARIDEESTKRSGGEKVDDGLREEERAAAAEEAAFVLIEGSLVHEAECLRLGGKLALTAAEVVFGEPEVRGVTLAGVAQFVKPGRFEVFQRRNVGTHRPTQDRVNYSASYLTGKSLKRPSLTNVPQAPKRV
jgi:hypothetical protein